MKTYIGLTTICAPFAKYFGIFNHIKHIVSLRILKQLYYALNYSRIQYGIEAYGSCAKESLSKLQIMQNKLLKLLLKWDRRAPTDLVLQRLSILKIDDVHIAKVVSFVNECRSCGVPEMFVNYYKTASFQKEAMRTQVALYLFYEVKFV